MEVKKQPPTNTAEPASRGSDEHQALRRQLLEMIKKNETLRQAKPR